jgi:23S rRNA pseudouridine1911/1915/1917 synthase
MSEVATRFQFTADKGDARLRLDQALVRHLGRQMRFSRAMAQRWIDAGRVVVNDLPVHRASQHVAEGALVAVALPADVPRKQAPAAQEGALDVLFEDEHLIILNKPAGVVVHPTYKHAEGTLINAVLWRTRHRPGAQPGVLTRLDKDTSGIVVVALEPMVHATLQKAAHAGHVTKEYLAVVRGVPRPHTGRIILPLGRDPDDRRRVVPLDDGAPSETRYEVESSNGGLSALRCRLVTGRTHQIRVHLAASGWPLIGDRAYGVPDASIDRQALHAWRLSLAHPVTGRDVQAEAPPPPDMARALAAAGWGEG